MDSGGLVFVFTEAPTKNLELAEALIETKTRWEENLIFTSIAQETPNRDDYSSSKIWRTVWG